jgi:hypothetical protein
MSDIRKIGYVNAKDDKHLRIHQITSMSNPVGLMFEIVEPNSVTEISLDANKVRAVVDIIAELGKEFL